MNEEKRLEMEELVSRLNEASETYYGGQSEIMSDYEWDALFDRLKRLEEETGVILEESPTRKVSGAKETGQKEAHEFAALSLAKTKKPEDLVKWAEGKPIWLSWKLDGLTLVVTYDNGKLTKVVTRGDGHVGTNITYLAEGIEGILSSIDYQGHLVIRGEAIISYDDFEKFRLESEEDYANPRNLASGSLTLKDVEELKKRHLHWIPFTLVSIEEEIPSWGSRMDCLEALGFHPVEREKIEEPNSENVNSAIERWTKKVTDGIQRYPVDGLVIGYDDTVYAAGGSVTGHHATRAGYAFKWQDSSAETSLDHIEWSCAAGSITPVAVFEPVELEGTTVKRANLCNISECERLGIGDKGTRLSVIKANKIIPKVIHVFKTEGNFEIPSVCPVCGALTKVQVSELSGTKTLKCTNPECTAKKLKKFTRFVSKAGCDIDGISEQTLDRFINEGWIKDYADIYKLMDHSESMKELDGFGEKSVANLSASIAKARTVADTKLIYALNIPLVGPDVAKKLLSAHPLEELFEIGKTTNDAEVFSSIDGIGPEKSSAFVNWCKQRENMAELEKIKQEIEIKATELAPTGALCSGLSFVVTGDVYHYKNRNELKAYIESQGGKVTGSVTKKTDYLINNDVTSTSGKNQKAKELNIPVISENEFIERFAVVQ